MEETMRPTILTLTVSLLCSAATIEAAAQQRNGKRGSNPSTSANPGSSQGASQSLGRGINGSAPAVGAQLGGTKAPWERRGMSRADWLLANRMASINHLRDVAERNGNEHLHDQADKLGAIARRQLIIHACEHGDHPCHHPESP
jgi:hypothetical protein